MWHKTLFLCYKYYIVAPYSPPSSSVSEFNEQFISIIFDLNESRDKVKIIGEFNIDIGKGGLSGDEADYID